MTLEPISPGSVVDVAYRRIRTLIEDGELGPSTRLRQGDLADALAISRTSVREALHRLTADELVEFKANRGFFVASFRLDAMLERLELRRILEPGFVRLATERATEEDLRVQNERYRLGASTIIDILQSQESLTQAGVDEVNARFTYLRAKAQIEALIGRRL